MSLHRIITATGIYFITFTCHRWFSLLGIVNGYDLVYNWFKVLSTNQHTITGYVIMPNHLHLLLHFSGSGHSLNRVIGNGKRFMAYDIVKRLEQQKEYVLLSELQRDVQPKERKRGKKHEVWIDSFDVKECRTERFILQKLHYIHNNPCAGKWKLAHNPLEYMHSSASFYISGKVAGYPVIDYRELMSVDAEDSGEDNIDEPTSPSLKV